MYVCTCLTFYCLYYLYLKSTYEYVSFLQILRGFMEDEEYVCVYTVCELYKSVKIVIC